MNKNVVKAEDSKEIEEFKKSSFSEDREIENENIRRMLTTKIGRQYILRQLKRAFPLGGGSLCTNEQGTYYNLGKFESYLEILLDLREAYWENEDEGKRYVGEILLSWFFDSKIA